MWITYIHSIKKCSNKKFTYTYSNNTLWKLTLLCEILTLIHSIKKFSFMEFTWSDNNYKVIHYNKKVFIKQRWYSHEIVRR